MQQRKAFTLIELLIVVAIIAILAAIAVPNFLEAQVRAKVSRVKADQRTIATALEAYYVDYNKYPEAFADVAAPGYTVDSTYKTKNPRIVRLVPLTTPVAYITSVFQDPFSREINTNPSRTTEDIRVYLYADRASYGRLVTSPFGGSDNGANIYRILWGTQFPTSAWLLRSDGPMGGTGTGSGLGTSVDKRDVYDPTNGTISTGNVFYMQGVGPLS